MVETHNCSGGGEGTSGCGRGEGEGCSQGSCRDLTSTEAVPRSTRFTDACLRTVAGQSSRIPLTN